MRVWNKASALWFPSRLGPVIGIASIAAGRRSSLVVFAARMAAMRALRVVRPQSGILSARVARARGDERLSGSKQRESDAIGRNEGSSAGAGQPRNARKDVSTDKGVRRQRSSDLGRALRSIYDDTLRETVPDDFKDLLGKLS